MPRSTAATPAVSPFFPVEHILLQEFVGDESSAAGFGAILRAMPEEAAVHGVIEAGSPADHIALPRDLARTERHGQNAAASRSLVNAVASLDLPAGPGAAYLTGEARTIQLVRTHLVQERDWNRRSIYTKPFWAPGKRGLH